MSIQEYCNKKLDSLHKVGDSCVLEGRITTLRSCVSRYQQESNLMFNVKTIENKLYVIVIKEK